MLLRFLPLHIIFFIVAAFSHVYAQPEQIKVGVKGGLNLSSVTGGIVDGLRSRNSIHAGVVAEFPISGRFSVQTELLYSQQGERIETDALEFTLPIIGSITASLEAVNKMDYVHLPILAQCYFGDNFSIHLGPQIGYLVSQKLQGSFSAFGHLLYEGDLAEPLKALTQVNSLTVFKTLDFAANFGLGYEVAGVFLQARYTFGLINTIAEELALTDDDLSRNNSVIQFSLGFKF